MTTVAISPAPTAAAELPASRDAPVRESTTPTADTSTFGGSDFSSADPPTVTRTIPAGVGHFPGSRGKCGRFVHRRNICLPVGGVLSVHPDRCGASVRLHGAAVAASLQHLHLHEPSSAEPLVRKAGHRRQRAPQHLQDGIPGHGVPHQSSELWMQVGYLSLGTMPAWMHLAPCQCAPQ